MRHDDLGETLFNEIVAATILDAIENPPDEDREAVQLSDLEGLAYQEVADVLEAGVT